jgi:hypothetical protein
MNHRALASLSLLCLGCPSTEPLDTQDSSPLDTGEQAPFEERFAFAVMADPHLYGSADHDARAEAAVAWLNAHAEERGIELVLIVGDIAWNSGVETAPALLGELSMPWVPITGDNEIQSSDEQAFFEAFEPQWQALEGQLEGFTAAPAPVDYPAYETQAWFGNHRFQHRGVSFVGLDWCARTLGGVFGEMADLHEIEGGSFDWMLESFAAVDGGMLDSVVMYSHHPMHLSPGAFDLAEMEALETALEPYAPQLYASFAGHYHMDGEELLDSELWEVFVTDATWDDEIRLRLVTVSDNGARFSYEHELISVE